MQPGTIKARAFGGPLHNQVVAMRYDQAGRCEVCSQVFEDPAWQIDAEPAYEPPPVLVYTYQLCRGTTSWGTLFFEWRLCGAPPGRPEWLCLCTRKDGPERCANCGHVAARIV